MLRHWSSRDVPNHGCHLSPVADDGCYPGCIFITHCPSTGQVLEELYGIIHGTSGSIRTDCIRLTSRSVTSNHTYRQRHGDPESTSTTAHGISTEQPHGRLGTCMTVSYIRGVTRLSSTPRGLRAPANRVSTASSKSRRRPCMTDGYRRQSWMLTTPYPDCNHLADGFSSTAI